MNQFPLYNNLLTDISSKDLKTIEKRNFIKNIKKLDQNGFELIYVLIRVYYIDKEDSTSFTIPYGGKFVKEDIKFDLEVLPFTLKQILYKFIFMHIKKMDDDKNDIANDADVNNAKNENV